MFSATGRRRPACATVTRPRSSSSARTESLSDRAGAGARLEGPGADPAKTVPVVTEVEPAADFWAPRATTSSTLSRGRASCLIQLARACRPPTGSRVRSGARKRGRDRGERPASRSRRRSGGRRPWPSRRARRPSRGARRTSFASSMPPRLLLPRDPAGRRDAAGRAGPRPGIARPSGDRNRSESRKDDGLAHDQRVEVGLVGRGGRRSPGAEGADGRRPVREHHDRGGACRVVEAHGDPDAGVGRHRAWDEEPRGTGDEEHQRKAKLEEGVPAASAWASQGRSAMKMARLGVPGGVESLSAGCRSSPRPA